MTIYYKAFVYIKHLVVSNEKVNDLYVDHTLMDKMSSVVIDIYNVSLSRFQCLKIIL